MQQRTSTAPPAPEAPDMHISERGSAGRRRDRPEAPDEPSGALRARKGAIAAVHFATNPIHSAPRFSAAIWTRSGAQFRSGVLCAARNSLRPNRGDGWYFRTRTHRWKLPGLRVNQVSRASARTLAASRANVLFASVYFWRIISRHSR